MSVFLVACFCLSIDETSAGRKCEWQDRTNRFFLSRGGVEINKLDVALTAAEKTHPFLPPDSLSAVPTT
jgi:hypothetical protein